MEINIKEHLSDDTLQEICEQEVRNAVRAHLKDENNLQRILSNQAYKLVAQYCDEVFNVNMKEQLALKVMEVVQNLSHYSVFQKPDVWDREPNNMYNFLQSELEKQKPVVAEIVREEVPKQTLYTLKQDVKGAISEAIQSYYVDN